MLLNTCRPRASRRIAHITNSPYLYITKERFKGYRQALEKHNKSYNEELIKYCNHSGMIETEVEEAITGFLQTKINQMPFLLPATGSPQAA